MAERRPPGFNVDLGFYDSDEVLSIPRKIRAAAIGVWTLCGSYSANKLGDGYVSAEVIKSLGGTSAIRTALMNTRRADGTLSPLWVDAGAGAIRFTRWSKWQRTAAEIKAYRDGEAERKRKAREAKKAAAEGLLQTDVDATYGSRDAHVDDTYGSREPQVPSDVNATQTSRNATGPIGSSGNSEMSGRTSAGRSQPVRPEDGDPRARTKTETETETKRTTHLSGYQDSGSGGISATPGADLVREIIPQGHPPTTLTALRLQASELLNNGTDRDTVAGALRLWLDKPAVGNGRTILASLCSEVIKARTAPATNGKTHKMRTALELAAEVRAEEQAQLEPAARRELE